VHSPLFLPPAPAHFFDQVFKGSGGAQNHTIIWGSKAQGDATQAGIVKHAASEGALVWVIGQSDEYLARFDSTLHAADWVHLAPDTPANINIFDSSSPAYSLEDALPEAVAHLCCSLGVSDKVGVKAVQAELELVGPDQLSFRALALLTDEMREYEGQKVSRFAGLARTLSWYADAGRDAYRGWKLDGKLTDIERAQAVRLALLRIFAQIAQSEVSRPKLICIEDASWLTHLQNGSMVDRKHFDFIERLLRRGRKANAVLLASQLSQNLALAEKTTKRMNPLVSRYIHFPCQITKKDLLRWNHLSL